MKRVLPTILVGVALIVLSGPIKAQSLSRDLKDEGTSLLAKAAREQGSAVRGAILFPQRKLDCAKCHASNGQHSLGPDLTQLGEEATDAYLVETILQPSKVIKKGFESVTVITTQGQTITGRIDSQDAKHLVLRDATEDGRRITLAKSDM